MARRGSNDFDLLPGISQRFVAAGGAQSLSHPFSHRNSPAARSTLNLTQFLFIKQNLEPLTHIVSINDSHD